MPKTLKLYSLLTLFTVIIGCLLLLTAMANNAAKTNKRTQWLEAVDLLSEESFADHNSAIRIIDTYDVGFRTDIGKGFWGISDLAWDEDKQRLYAISDHGELHHLQLTFSDGHLQTIKLLDTYILNNANNEPLKLHDSEGMALRKNQTGQHELLIAFEHKPRVLRYSLQGQYLGELTLPAALQDKKNFRGGNSMFESVIDHPQLGVLVAAEFPLKPHSIKDQHLYDLNGNTCQFKAANAKRSSVTAIELMADQQSILVLERAWAGFTHPLVITLKKISFFDKQKTGSKLYELSACQTHTLASLSTDDGWEVDNFEGLAHLGKDRYIMVSDDNNNPFQRTLFVYFEVLK